MRFWIFLFTLLSLIPLAFADTTFFDQDDVFIMGDSATGGVIITEEQPASSSGGGCLTNWICSSWSSCVDGIQTRNCAKEKAYCYADLNKKPIESQNCSIKTENNSESEEGNLISKSPPVNFQKIIILTIGLIVIFGAIVFFAYKRHKKRKY